MSQRPAGLSGECVARGRELLCFGTDRPKQPIQGSYAQTAEQKSEGEQSQIKK